MGVSFQVSHVTQDGGESRAIRHRKLSCRELTSALLGKHQVSLLGRRQIRHTVASVEQVWALALRQPGVFPDLQRLVMSEATAGK